MIILNEALRNLINITVERYGRMKDGLPGCVAPNKLHLSSKAGAVKDRAYAKPTDLRPAGNVSLKTVIHSYLK